MTRYQLSHRTDYSYAAAVTSSYGRAHLHPRDIAGEQHTDSAELIVSPEPVERREHQDYFGNISTYFVVTTPHTKLRVESRCRVDVVRNVHPIAELDQRTWHEVAAALPGNNPVREFTLPSPMIANASAVNRYAATIFDRDTPFGQSLTALLDRIHSDMRYKAGVTTIGTTLTDVLDIREGVCQDFAHLAVAALRSVGLAARYVSGYLETSPPPGRPKLQGADASHAWASVWTDDHGWIDIDPTNNQFVDDRYIAVGWGRDYSDVPPLKGVIFTDAKRSTMRVSVDVDRVPSPTVTSDLS
jgi:transglutaminase-like putative cysteine protease